MQLAAILVLKMRVVVVVVRCDGGDVAFMGKVAAIG